VKLPDADFSTRAFNKHATDEPREGHGANIGQVNMFGKMAANIDRSYSTLRYVRR
jgi:hypothetical protein